MYMYMYLDSICMKYIFKNADQLMLQQFVYTNHFIGSWSVVNPLLRYPREVQ